jgi:hypothetical protein
MDINRIKVFYKKFHGMYNWDIFLNEYNVYKDRTDSYIRRYKDNMGIIRRSDKHKKENYYYENFENSLC